MNESLCFDDVLLVPQYSEITSRHAINLSTDLGDGIELTLPIVSSPMDTVTEYQMASKISQLGGLGIIHRYNSIHEQCLEVRNAKAAGAKYVGAAIGVSDDAIQRAKALLDAGADVLCIDVAHGHHIGVRDILYFLRKKIGKRVHIMAGNVATLKATNDLADWGASSLRISIGGGSICSTRIQTGHGVPTLQAILDCSKTNRDVRIIADGGIRTSGDIVKSLAAGASAVMLGSLLAGTDEAPGTILSNNHGEKYKIYRGMASVEAQVIWRGKTSSIEGIAATVPYKGSVENVIANLQTGIRSGLSYSGALTINELQRVAQFTKMTSNGLSESKTHILNSH